LIESRKIYQQIKNTNDLNYPHMHPFEFQRFLNTTLSAIDNTLDWISESHPEPSFEDISYYYASQFVTPIKILREKAPYDCMGDALSEQCISEWFKETPDAFSYLSEELKNDKAIVLLIAKHWGRVLERVTTVLQDDKDVVLAAVQNDARALQFASDELKDDKVINLAAIQNDVWAFEFVSDELKDDFKFMLDAIEKEPFAFKYASDKLKKTLCFQAINKMPFLRFFMQYPRETSTAALGLTIIIAVSTIMNYRNTLKKTIDLESNPTSIKSRLMGLQNKPNPTNIAPDDADEMISTPSKYK
jgi:hypothetical protein